MEIVSLPRPLGAAPGPPPPSCPPNLPRPQRPQTAAVSSISPAPTQRKPRPCQTGPVFEHGGRAFSAGNGRRYAVAAGNTHVLCPKRCDENSRAQRRLPRKIARKILAGIGRTWVLPASSSGGGRARTAARYFVSAAGVSVEEGGGDQIWEPTRSSAAHGQRRG